MTPLLDCLVGAASCRDRPTAAIALEGLVPLMESRRLSAAQIGALLPALLLHAQYIDEAAEFEDEDEADVYFDADEWSRVRDQTLSDVFLALYEGQRLALLQHVTMSFEQAISAQTWRAAEAALFAVGVVAPGILRVQLVRDPKALLKTPAAQAEGLTAESLAAQQQATRELLVRIFNLTLAPEVRCLQMVPCSTAVPRWPMHCID